MAENKLKTIQFPTISEAIEDVKRGEFVIVIDDEDRENEGDLIIAAEKATPEKINFMLKHGRGLVCMPIIAKRLDELELPQMVDNITDAQCAFTLSIDAKNNTTTGVSAYDRAATIKAVLDPNTNPEDLRKPGHTFPLKYKEGGVLKRRGHTEASVDLAMRAGLYPAAVICEILDQNGHVAKLNELIQFSQKHNIKIISIDDLVKHLEKNENSDNNNRVVNTNIISIPSD